MALKNDPIEGAPISDWLSVFLKKVDIRTAAGIEFLSGLIGSEFNKVLLQNPNSSEPTQSYAAYNNNGWRIYPVNDLDKLPPVQWLIDNEIPAKSLTVLYGTSGSGKSFIALDYALRIAQHAPVVYVAAEGETGYADRKNAWISHFRNNPGSLYFCFNTVRMLDLQNVKSFTDAVIPISPKLIVIDTLARCMVGGDENSARDMGLFVESCDQIKQQLDAAVLVVHHTGKNSASERGSSALRGACESMIELSNDDGLITLSCSKSKDAQPFAPRFLRLVNVQVSPQRSSCAVIPSDKVAHVKGQPLTANQKAVLQALKMETFLTVGAKSSQLISTCGISERTIYRVLSPLIKWGYVEQGKRGDPYKITEEGFNLKLD